MEDKGNNKKSTVYSATFVDSNDKLIEYCTLTAHKEGHNVEFSVISSNGQAYVGVQVYEDEEHWEEVLKVLKRVPSICLVPNAPAKLKKIGLKLSPVNLTETQQLAFRVANIESEIQNFNKSFLWNPVPRTALGNFNFSADKVNYKIPDVVPTNAKEIFVSIFLKLNSPPNSEVDVSIATKVDDKLLYNLIRAQGSVSQNFWLPLNTQDRNVYVESKVTDNYTLSMEIIGYRE